MPESEPRASIERSNTIEKGFRRIIRSQLPRAHSERIMRLYDNVAGKLPEEAQEQSKRAREKVEKGANIVGWGISITEAEVLGASLLFGGVAMTQGVKKLRTNWNSESMEPVRDQVDRMARETGFRRYLRFIVGPPMFIWDFFFKPVPKAVPMPDTGASTS